MSRNSQRAILRDVAKGILKIDKKGKPVKNVAESVVDPVVEEAVVLEEKVEKKKTTSSRKKYKKSTSSKA